MTNDTAWSLGPEFVKARAVVQYSTWPLNISHGPVRAGKSVGANIRWIEYTQTGPPGDLLMWGRTERTVLRNVILPMQQQFGHGFIRVNRGEGIVHIGKRTVYYVGANDESAYTKIQGLTLAGGYGDEGTLTPESFFDMFITRLSVPDALAFLTTNPGPPRHYLRTKWLLEPDKGVRGFAFKLHDNPTLTPDFVARMKRSYTGLFYRRYILGEWVAAEGSVFPSFDPDRHVRPALEMPRLFTRHAVGVDYGAANPTAFVLMSWDGDDGRAWVRRLYYHDGRVAGVRTDEEHARALADLTAHLPRRIGSTAPACPIVVDPSALHFMETLRRRGFDVRPADNRVEFGLGLVGMLLDNDRLRILDVPETLPLVDEFGSYEWDTKASEKGHDKPVKRNDHAIDGLRYVVATLLHYLASSDPTGAPVQPIILRQ